MNTAGTTGLVLEGGGMRGFYTAGVLDALIEQGITFSYIIGVSAGACNAVSFAAKQKGRYYNANYHYINDKRYFSMQNFLKTGYLFGSKFVFETLSYELEPVDEDGYQRFIKSGGTFLSVATDCRTGTPVYTKIRNLRQDGIFIQASSSLPFLSAVVKANGHSLLDGGLSDSIPIQKSIADGNDKNIVILTQHRQYRKPPSRLHQLCRLRYPMYPKLANCIKNRFREYNACLDFINRQEAQGKALVLCPDQPVSIARMEKDLKKLDTLYRLGFADGRKKADEIRWFMQ